MSRSRVSCQPLWKKFFPKGMHHLCGNHEGCEYSLFLLSYKSCLVLSFAANGSMHTTGNFLLALFMTCAYLKVTIICEYQF